MNQIEVYGESSELDESDESIFDLQGKLGEYYEYTNKYLPDLRELGIYLFVY